MNKYVNMIKPYKVLIFYFLFALILILASFNIFNNLGVSSIDNFDEARQGVNAYEMIKSGNYTVNTYGGVNDYYNLNPPLSLYGNVLGFKLFGFNAFGLRFFSALAMFLTVLAVGIYTKLKFGKTASIISLLIVSTTTALLILHSARTGNADSMLILFVTLSLIAFSLIDRNYKYLYLSGFFFSLAFLTESWHALPVLIIIGIYYLLYRKQINLTIKNIVIYLLIIATPILIWALIRFQYDGIAFFKAMVELNLLNRSNSVLESHSGGILFYIDDILMNFNQYFILFWGGLVAYLVMFKGKIDKNITFLLLSILIPLSLFSIVKTKLPWYILSIFPVISILIGVFYSYLLREKSRVLKFLCVFLILLFVFVYQEKYIFQIVTNNKANASYTQFLFEKIGRNSTLINHTIYKYDNWEQKDFLSAELYSDLLPKNGGFNAFLKDNLSMIIISKDKYISNKDKFNSLDVVANNNYYYLLKH